MDVISTQRDAVGESPLWSAAEAALYWVDIEGRRLRRWASTSGQVTSWPTDERIACIAPHAHGGFIAGMESGVFHLRPGDDGALVAECLAAIRHAQPGMRFNDGRCDRTGMFWAGTMVMDMSLASPAGGLFRVDGQGLSAPQVSGLVTQNGLAFSPDGSTMYLSDSHPSVRRIWAFDRAGDGGLSRRREFVDMNQHPGRPDGAAVDADGGYWICANDAGLVHRFTPDGRLDRSIAVPAAKPSMCAFGGSRLDELFITSIAPARPVEGYDPALAGAVFVCRPGVAGLPEAPFQPRFSPDYLP